MVRGRGISSGSGHGVCSPYCPLVCIGITSLVFGLPRLCIWIIEVRILPRRHPRCVYRCIRNPIEVVGLPLGEANFDKSLNGHDGDLGYRSDIGAHIWARQSPLLYKLIVFQLSMRERGLSLVPLFFSRLRTSKSLSSFFPRSERTAHSSFPVPVLALRGMVNSGLPSAYRILVLFLPHEMSFAYSFSLPSTLR
ncbi:hypothetical protein FRC08_015527 [Ceratobasidium sp. 394]|nr:hypothetical protein FRC08_015527 [Ceratobasidium sp. 394]